MDGVKHDHGKDRWDLMEWGPLVEIVKVFTVGAEKYSDRNYMNVEKKRFVSALMRHTAAYLQGEENDPDDGLSHLAHAAANLIILRAKDLEEEKNKEARNRDLGLVFQRERLSKDSVQC